MARRRMAEDAPILGPSLEDAVWTHLHLKGSHKLHLLFGTVLTYFCFCADIAAGVSFVENDTAWWHRWTLAIAFLPGLCHCVIQHTAVYREPAGRPAPGEVRLGEKAPNKRPRNTTGAQWVGYWLVTFLQLRTLLEFVLSHRWQFETGAWRDARVIQVCVQSVPQAVLQSWIIFSDWGTGAAFDWNRVFISLACAFANICMLPVGSPCCEDNRRLARVGGDEDDEDDEDDDDDDGWGDDGPVIENVTEESGGREEEEEDEEDEDDEDDEDGKHNDEDGVELDDLTKRKK